MERQEAKEKGLVTYVTGTPCPSGHIAERYTSTGNCKECARIRAMRSYTPTTTRKREYNDIQSFKKAASKKHDNLYSYGNSIYTNAHTPLSITCRYHGEFKQNPTNHMQGKGCPQCAAEASRAVQIHTVDHFIEKATIVWGSQFSYIKTKYEGAKVPIQLICNTHPDETIWQAPSNHLGGRNPCPKCSWNSSSAEGEIADYVAQFAPMERGRKDILKPYEVDIWVPSHNLAIEYHGLYWHTTDRVGMKHREKWQVSVENGMRLIQIFEDEWLDSPEIVKARLRALLGSATKIHARKTTLKQITFKQARDFLVERHTQGAGTACMAFGLYYEEALVAVATFGRSRTGGMTADTSDAWEVYRYASEGTIVGGFGKLLKHFITHYSPSKIISYCDLRYGNGSLYKNTGFTLQTITEADYWWVPKGQVKRIPRYQTQKHKLATHPLLKQYYSIGKTENQICEEAGWKKIHGVGNQKWVMDLTNNE